MSAIVVVRDSIERWRQEAADAELTAAGFPKLLDHAGPGWTLRCYGPLNDAPDAVNVFNPGNFAASVGTFVYKGRIGKPALEQVHHDVKSGAFQLADATGHFALAVCIDGALQLHTDPLGAFRIFHDPGMRVLSTRLIPVAAMMESLEIDAQGLYEFLWFSAAKGGRTIFRQVASLPASALVAVQGDAVHVSRHSEPAWRAPDMTAWPMDQIVRTMCDGLVQQVGKLASHSGNRLSASISGGFDSRLVLATLRHLGVKPNLFVYGYGDRSDLRVAETIARTLDFELTVTQRRRDTPLSPDDFAAEFHQNAVVFDGIKLPGLLGPFRDIADRSDRVRGALAITSGSGGEIFRNFFYLPDRRYRVDHLVSAFYSTYDPNACTAEFAEPSFRRAVAVALAANIGADPDQSLDRTCAELAYPLFRVRYWTTVDIYLNQGFGWALYPYALAPVIAGTATIPLRFKNFGRLEARMIAHLDRELAGIASAYGFDFLTGPTARYRMSLLESYHRPTWLRRYSYRMRARSRSQDPPNYLQNPYVAKLVDPGLPVMSRYVHVDKVSDIDVLSRIYSVEYLMSRYPLRRTNAGSPPPNPPGAR